MSAILVFVVFFSPEDSQYGHNRLRYLGLFAFFCTVSALGAYFRWGPLVFGTVLGSLIGMTVPLSISEKPLTVALPYVAAGMTIGLVVDIVPQLVKRLRARTDGRDAKMKKQ